MTSVWESVSNYYYDVLENQSDPRVKDWPMMSEPFTGIFIIITYVYFVKVIGPKLMKNRKPFVLRRVMIYYNLFQVVLSTWITYGALKNGWWSDYSFSCQPIDFSNSPKAIGMAKMCWWYHIAKFTELLDTIFFVMRKKNNQITNLHVYHHGIMPILTWFGCKLLPGGHLTFFGLLNSFVHIVMYGYYLLAAFGPKMQPYLWWKKYLTSLQIIQFVIIMIHTFQFFFIECDFPKMFSWLILSQAILFFVLFNQFYRASYVKKEK